MKIAEEKEPRMKYLRPASPDAARRRLYADIVYSDMDRISRPRKRLMKPAASAIRTAPGRAQQHEDVRLGAVEVFPHQVAVRRGGPDSGGAPEQYDEKGAEVVVNNLVPERHRARR